jgi:hypothetical protein
VHATLSVRSGIPHVPHSSVHARLPTVWPHVASRPPAAGWRASASSARSLRPCLCRFLACAVGAPLSFTGSIASRSKFFYADTGLYTLSALAYFALAVLLMTGLARAAHRRTTWGDPCAVAIRQAAMLTVALLLQAPLYDYAPFNIRVPSRTTWRSKTGLGSGVPLVCGLLVTVCAHWHQSRSSRLKANPVSVLERPGAQAGAGRTAGAGSEAARPAVSNGPPNAAVQLYSRPPGGACRRA